jgi:hypothetical protein
MIRMTASASVRHNGLRAGDASLEAEKMEHCVAAFLVAIGLPVHVSEALANCAGFPV